MANFCDPETYPDLATIRDLARSGVSVTVGLHPKGAQSYSANDISALRRLLDIPEVVGMGEIGFDRTVLARDWDAQRQVLRDSVRLLGDHHVLVLHCRPSGQVYSIFTELQQRLRSFVRLYHPIHLHCFSGDRAEIENWLCHFPRIHFGFTRMVDGFKKRQLEGLRFVDDERLLLETDAPYFGFRGVASISNPTLIGLTAQAVAKARGSATEDILRVTTDNARRLCLQRD